MDCKCAAVPMAMLVQTLVVRDSRVLLGRWRSGAFCGRITGLLGSAPGTAIALPSGDATFAATSARGVGCILGVIWSYICWVGCFFATSFVLRWQGKQLGHLWCGLLNPELAQGDSVPLSCLQ